jgi:hypothetical protein
MSKASNLLIRFGHAPILVEGLDSDALAALAALVSADGKVVDDIQNRINEIVFHPTPELPREDE